MSILLFILQGALALLYLAGGSYKVFQFDELASQMLALSRGGWRALGVFEMVGGVLLIVPASLSGKAAFVAAVALAIETFVLAALYARYSLELSATNPMVWALGMGVAVTIVAIGRRTRVNRS